MSGDFQSASTPPSASVNNLTVPAGTNEAYNPGIVRRLSQIASNFALSPVESQLTDEAIIELGGKLLKDYIRDRLFRNGILSDDHEFIEENNNIIEEMRRENESNVVVNPPKSELLPHDHSPESSQYLSVSRRPVSRSNSFNRVQRQSSPSARSDSLPRSPISPLPTDGSLVDGGSFSASQRSRTSVSSTSTPAAQPVDAIAVVLRRFCLYLEKAHTNTYREVSRPLCITMASVDVIRDAINHIAVSVLKDVKDSDVASNTHAPNAMWAKIASLFVLTSTFCLDCTVQGHASHIGDVISIALESIFCKKVCDRIRSVGGWSNLVDVSKNSKKEKDLLPVVLVVAMGAVLGLIPAWLFHLITPQLS